MTDPIVRKSMTMVLHIPGIPLDGFIVLDVEINDPVAEGNEARKAYGVVGVLIPHQESYDKAVEYRDRIHACWPSEMSEMAIAADSLGRL